MSAQRNVIASALCSRLSLDPKSCECSGDIKSLYLNCLKSSGKWSAEKESDDVMKWIRFAETFPVDAQACFSELCKLNEDLIPISILLGNGLTPSEVDVIVFAAIYSAVTGLPQAEREKKLPHLMRWMDYIQHKEDMGNLFDKIAVEKVNFNPPCPASKGSAETEAESKGKPSKAKESTEGKKKPSETETGAKDELSISLLNIQVGLIRKAWKHPSADSLLVEEIDVGEAKLRQVVSGLAKYINPDELTNRRVVLITNVKPGKLRDVMSEGLVLCASNEDHTVVEPLLPPEGAKIGECVSFSGIDGKPEDVLNPKKKQLEKITPNLFTDEKGVATFKGIPFMTSGGPCTASIPKASIK